MRRSGTERPRDRLEHPLPDRGEAIVFCDPEQALLGNCQSRLSEEFIIPRQWIDVKTKPISTLGKLPIAQVVLEENMNSQESVAVLVLSVMQRPMGVNEETEVVSPDRVKLALSFVGIQVHYLDFSVSSALLI